MIVYHANNKPYIPFDGRMRMARTRMPSPVQLDYTIKKVEKGLLFQVNNQSPQITDFLKKNRFQASNGMIIASAEFPELKDSTNHIYLWGAESRKNGKLDATSYTHNFKRDNKYEIVKQALREFVEYVDAISPKWQDVSCYTPYFGVPTVGCFAIG